MNMTSTEVIQPQPLVMITLHLCKIVTETTIVSCSLYSRRHDYEDIDDVLLPKPPLPYHHSDSRPNGRVSTKVPAPHQSSINNKEISSPRKIEELHSKNVDTLLSNTRYVVCFT